jgi:hypothetical protein
VEELTPMQYDDFDLLIERAEKISRARVNSPTGQAAAEFAWPFSEAELKNRLEQIGPPLGISLRSAFFSLYRARRI